MGKIQSETSKTDVQQMLAYFIQFHLGKSEVAAENRKSLSLSLGGPFSESSRVEKGTERMRHESWVSTCGWEFTGQARDAFVASVR